MSKNVAVTKNRGQSALSSYKFDTSSYVVLSSGVRREAETGRFVEVKKSGQGPKKK